MLGRNDTEYPFRSRSQIASKWLELVDKCCCRAATHGHILVMGSREAWSFYARSKDHKIQGFLTATNYTNNRIYCNQTRGNSNILLHHFGYLVAMNNYVLQWSHEILQPTNIVAISTTNYITLEI